MNTDIQGYADKYKEQIEGCMRCNDALDSSDSEIERTLGACVCAHFLVPAAKNLRDRGVLQLGKL